MQEWKLPPIAKIYEALGAVADGRVTKVDEHTAKVSSSSGDKFYTVEWADGFDWISSNDNASYWQGYIGYPIIAVLIQEGVLQINSAAADLLKGVAWKQINTKYKNNFDKTIQDVLAAARDRGGDPATIINECKRLAGELEKLRLRRPGKKRPPAKSVLKTEQPPLL